MRRIFISYRREDTEGQAGRLFDDLSAHFGKDSVFMDVTGIAPGFDFRNAIDHEVSACDVFLAIIGKHWIDAIDESGNRRLDNPDDFVRLETATALKRDIPVVPVLVQGMRMPRADQLPTDLKALAWRNAVELTHARWGSDVELLIKALCRHLEAQQVRPGSEEFRPAEKEEPGKVPRKRSWRAIVAGVVAVIAGVIVGLVIYDHINEVTPKQQSNHTMIPNMVTIPPPQQDKAQVIVLFLDEYRKAEAYNLAKILEEQLSYRPNVRPYNPDTVAWKFESPIELHYFYKTDQQEAIKIAGVLEAKGISVKPKYTPVEAKLVLRYFEIWLQSR